MSRTRKSSKAGPAVVVVILAVGAYLGWRHTTPNPGSPEAAPAVSSPTNAAAAATSEAPPAFRRLLGRWVRPDGGYILSIGNVGADGKLEAAYFNPSPINVFKAEATQNGASTEVFIELRDVNYPGSTYRLKYDPLGDALSGVYFQATMQENFDVSFVRMNPN